MNPSKFGWLGVGAVASGIAASACCIGPVLIATVGIGGLGTLGFFARLEPFRLIFILLAAGLLAVGFYRTYKKSGAEDCCSPTRRRVQKAALWVASAVVLGAILFPYLIR